VSFSSVLRLCAAASLALVVIAGSACNVRVPTTGGSPTPVTDVDGTGEDD